MQHKSWVYFTFLVLFRLAHSRIRLAFKAYSIAGKRRWMSSTRVQFHFLDLLCLNIHLVPALMYTDHPDDENCIKKPCVDHRRPNYTLGFNLNFWALLLL